ncbi:hypothetical protein Lal_00047423 [Lupinus albus]|uniref:Putative CRIB domain-containing protein n=1 Tax=Lupinus albus TaxID=3870 RepID=A0A6A4QXU8_LUPAL|nr:putative CRIB domain-containing protein [Lupinus albus]KAF1878751.1 hypothetical protein Lal_00047423 [Lupinus albus]
MSTMATKLKGICKSFKYITQIFVAKEREMEIGYPTDVKHLTHIGWDGPSGSKPSWMSHFETAPDFTTSRANLGGLMDPNPLAMSTSSSSQDFEEPTGIQPKNTYKGIPFGGVPHVPKKPKRKKVKSTSSSESLSASSRTAKSVARYSEREATPIAQV